MGKLTAALASFIAEVAMHVPMGPGWDGFLERGKALKEAAESLEKRCLVLEDQVRALEALVDTAVEEGLCRECRVNSLNPGEMICGACFGKNWLKVPPDSDNADD